MEIKYWIEVVKTIKKKIEDLYFKQKKIWDSINVHIQQLDLPTFSVFDDFKEKIEILFQVKNSISHNQIEL